jgi:spermidine/putrescine-binding protein
MIKLNIRNGHQKNSRYTFLQLFEPLKISSGMIRKRYDDLVVLFVLLGLIVSGCATPTPTPAATDTSNTTPTSKVLNLYAWTDYIPQQLLDDFTAKYGITVEYDAYSSNEEMLAKLQAGASGYDISIPSDYAVEIMVKEGMLEKINVGQIPNFNNLDTRFTNLYYDPDNQYSVPYQWGTTAMGYDKKNMPFEPRSWSALWDPRLKGRVVLLDDEREVMGVALRVLGFDKNSTDPQQLKKAEQKLVELKSNILQFNSDDPETSIISGEAWVGLIYNGNATLANRTDPNIGYICPTEGCGIWFDNLVIPIGAPHADAAKAFINFVLDPQESILITNEFPYSNPNRAALDQLKADDSAAYDTYMAFPWTNPPAAFLAHTVSVHDLGDATKIYDQLWSDFRGQ